MLIFVSDLHLTDCEQRRSFDIPAFVRAIDACISRPSVSAEIKKLVLLGDIFELLKSDVWIERQIRPWSASRGDVATAAAEILEGIGRQNGSFFAALQELRAKHGVELDYIPGNHDALVADMSVNGMRERVRQLIPGLPGAADAKFEEPLIDFEHGVIAEHGHQLDDFNMRIGGSCFVPGDAVVVEMLVKLPRVAAQKLGSRAESAATQQFQERLLFLQELDNVLPQDLSGMMRWLELKMEGLPASERRELGQAISSAVRECGITLRAALKEHGASRFLRRVIWALVSHRLFSSVPALRLLARLPMIPADQGMRVRRRLGYIGAVRGARAQALDLYVAGHTHATTQEEFPLLRGHPMTYLNTGTWRRVHTPARRLVGVKFQLYYEETLLCVHRLELRQSHGRYEFLRYVRGL